MGGWGMGKRNKKPDGCKCDREGGMEREREREREYC